MEIEVWIEVAQFLTKKFPNVTILAGKNSPYTLEAFQPVFDGSLR